MAKPLVKKEGNKLVVPEAENQCAFHVQAVDNVCSDQFTIQKMKEFVKSLNPTAPIDNATPAQTVELAKQAVNCDSEVCLFKNAQLTNIIGVNKADEIINNRFKPSGPANSTAWLTNSNIDLVMHQWTKLYPGFFHVPFQMIDFDTMHTELAETDLCDLAERGMKTLGCVINTDRSTGNGIHWFCIFIDLTGSPWTLEYFDSAGDYPKESVHKWLNTQRANLANRYPDKQINVVDVTKSNQLQKSTTECGVFSLWYILSRLNKIPYQYFSQPNATDDNMMYEFRKFLFRHELNKSGGTRRKSG